MQDHVPWGDCPPGVVTGMAGQLRRSKLRSQRRSVIALGGALLLMVAIGYGLTSRDQAGSRARLNCRDAVPLFAKYHEESLAPADAEDVREHLSHCPACRRHYEELFPSEVRNRESTKTRQVALAASFRR